MIPLYKLNNSSPALLKLGRPSYPPPQKITGHLYGVHSLNQLVHHKTCQDSIYTSSKYIYATLCKSH